MKKIVSLLILTTLSAYADKLPVSLKENKPQISFTENKGQVHDQNNKARPDVLFGGESKGLVFHLRDKGISYQLQKPIGEKKQSTINGIKEPLVIPSDYITHRIDINWINMNHSCQIVKEGVFPGYTNFYSEVCPNGALEVKTYSDVLYKKLYDGIDIYFYNKNGNLKYDYLVQPNADYRNIQLQISGAEKIKLNRFGELVIKTGLGEIIEAAPLVIQGGKQKKSKWKINGNIVSFEIFELNKNESFIIDPMVSVREWGTFYGGSGVEQFGSGCSADSNGNVYLCGTTQSNTGTVIATSGSHQSVHGGGPSAFDAFLAKFDALGVRQWGTYYGSTTQEGGMSCATDNFGNVYMSGFTSSTVSIATAGCHQPTFNGAQDAFLVKFNSAGIRKWGTYYGGVNTEYGYCCATDVFGNVYMSGRADSPTDIASPGCFQSTQGSGFLAKFDSVGVRQWGTYYNGFAYGCSADLNGNVYLSGTSGATVGIASPGSHQPTTSGVAGDAYLAKFDQFGARLWGTYYGAGASATEMGNSCSADKFGNVYLTGYTTNSVVSTATVIATPGSHQSNFGGGTFDAFLVKFSGSGVRRWGTFYGGITGIGGTTEEARFCTNDPNGNVYICGRSNTSTGTVMATPGNHQPLGGGFSDTGYLVKFDSTGVREWGTYYGNGVDCADCCATNNTGNIFMCGTTNSGFPASYYASPGCHQSSYGGNTGDYFLVRFKECTGVTNAVVGTNSVACFGGTTGSATITASGGTGITYSWMPSGGTSSVAVGLGAGNYTCEAMNSCGAKTTSTVNIAQPSFLNLVTSVTNSVICAGNSSTLTATAFGGTGIKTYTWSTGATSTLIVVSPTSTTVYTVMTTDANNCVASKTIGITVNAVPSLTISGNTSICSGNSATLTANGATTYSWSSGSTNTIVVLTPSTSTTFTLIGTSGAGCTNTITQFVSINPLPSVAASSSSVCAGTSGCLAVNAIAAATYTWVGPCGFVTNIQNPCFTFNLFCNCIYTVTVADANGCVNSSTTCLNVYPNPTVTAVTSNSIICGPPFPGTASLTANGATSYTWNTSSTTSVIAVSPSITTTYSVTGTDANGCQNTAMITQSVSTCTGINESFVTTQIAVFPNPTKGILKVVIPDNFIESSIEIYNAIGERIYKSDIQSKRIDIDLSKEASGIYFVKTGNTVTKVIKE